MKSTLYALFLSMIVLAPFVSGEVMDSASNGFTVSNKITIQGDSTHAFDAILKIGNWWNSEHTYFGSAKNMTLDPSAGGCFCEIEGKKQVRHGTVIFIDPGKFLRIDTALGPLQEQGVAGALTFQVTAAEAGSEIKMTFRAGGYMPGGMDKIAPIVDAVLGEQLSRLKMYIDTGDPDKK